MKMMKAIHSGKVHALPSPPLRTLAIKPFFSFLSNWHTYPYFTHFSYVWKLTWRFLQFVWYVHLVLSVKWSCSCQMEDCPTEIEPVPIFLHFFVTLIWNTFFPLRDWTSSNNLTLFVTFFLGHFFNIAPQRLNQSLHQQFLHFFMTLFTRSFLNNFFTLFCDTFFEIELLLPFISSLQGVLWWR